MANQVIELKVNKRETGKTGRRGLADDVVRGVVYGKEVESTPIAVDYNTLG